MGQDHNAVAARADDASKAGGAGSCPQRSGVGGRYPAGQQHDKVITPKAHLQARD